MPTKKIDYFIIILLAFNLILGAWYVLHGTINFHTDIARDFLLLEDIVVNRNITLIGPRSGGIPGVFHGPLWIYLNIPAFIIGQGNPVIVGWFWVLLYLVSVLFVYYVGKKLFDSKTGLLSALLYSSVIANSVHSMFNPFGAVLFFPIFFYYFVTYVEQRKMRDLLIGMFVLGIIIQFQMAFGIPLLALIIPYLVYLIIKKKNYTHLLALTIIIIPLSSFILFDLRHDFLQTRSVINYISGVENAGKVKDSFVVLLFNRSMIMVKEAVGMVAHYNLLWTLLMVGAFIFAFRKSSGKILKKYHLFIFLFVGYWIITLIYKGVMWGYYFWPFVGVISIMFVSTKKFLNPKLFAFIFIGVFVSNMIIIWNSTVSNPMLKTDNSLWGFFKNVADEVYTDAPNEFGYYIYTNDQFGYSSRYAMNYVQKKYPGKQSFPFEKKSTTYLLIDDEGNHKFTNNKDWKTYDVKIGKKPVNVIQKNKTYSIEKYNLTPEEVSVQSNPNLIHTLIFR